MQTTLLNPVFLQPSLVIHRIFMVQIQIVLTLVLTIKVLFHQKYQELQNTYPAGDINLILFLYVFHGLSLIVIPLDLPLCKCRAIPESPRRSILLSILKTATAKQLFLFICLVVLSATCFHNGVRAVRVLGSVYSPPTQKSQIHTSLSHGVHRHASNHDVFNTYRT